MGLSISVGVLVDPEDEEGAEWFREDLTVANELLAARRLPLHDESEVAVGEPRSSIDGFPYGWLHTLRRAYAHGQSRPGKPLAPLSPTDDRADDADVARLSREGRSHLICHSDAEGYYVPVDFEQVIVDPNVTGEILGSTQRLKMTKEHCDRAGWTRIFKASQGTRCRHPAGAV